MGDKTSIQWTDATWNPIVGCDRVSAGCDHCYAATLHNRRYLAWKRGTFPTAPVQYHQPFWGKGGGVQLMSERLEQPLHWRKPRRVFVNSVSDLFHEDVPDTFIAQVFAVMAQTSWHTFQVLTKRPERMAVLLASERFRLLVDDRVSQLAERCRSDRIAFARYHLADWPLTNVWLGTSVEDQAAADERIPLLLETPAAVRFLSCEPLLGPVDLIGDAEHYGPMWHKRAMSYRTDYGTGTEWDVDLQCGIDWVIIGGESGPHARVMAWHWLGGLLVDCRKAGVPVFVKQLGTYWAKYHGLKDRHGGDPSEWPEHARVRAWPHSAREAEMA